MEWQQFKKDSKSFKIDLYNTGCIGSVIPSITSRSPANTIRYNQKHTIAFLLRVNRLKQLYGLLKLSPALSHQYSITVTIRKYFRIVRALSLKISSMSVCSAWEGQDRHLHWITERFFLFSRRLSLFTQTDRCWKLNHEISVETDFA